MRCNFFLLKSQVINNEITSAESGSDFEDFGSSSGLRISRFKQSSPLCEEVIF